jgi:hypothetical protein
MVHPSLVAIIVPVVILLETKKCPLADCFNCLIGCCLFAVCTSRIAHLLFDIFIGFTLPPLAVDDIYNTSKYYKL